MGVRLTGDHSNWLQVPFFPIQRITRLIIDDQEVDPKFVAIQPGGRIQLRRDGPQTIFPATDVENIQLDFVYGYASVPLVVTNAVVILSTILAQGGEDGVVQSQSDGKISISAKVGKDLSAQFDSALDMVGKGMFATAQTPSISKNIEWNPQSNVRFRNINR